MHPEKPSGGRAASVARAEAPLGRAASAGVGAEGGPGAPPPRGPEARARGAGGAEAPGLHAPGVSAEDPGGQGCEAHCERGSAPGQGGRKKLGKDVTGLSWGESRSRALEEHVREQWRVGGGGRAGRNQADSDGEIRMSECEEVVGHGLGRARGPEPLRHL